MVSSADIRTIAYDIIVRHIEEPQSVSSIKMIRAFCEIDSNDDKSTNIQKLCKRYNKEESELKSFFAEMGVTLEDIEKEIYETVVKTCKPNYLEEKKIQSESSATDKKNKFKIDL